MERERHPAAGNRHGSSHKIGDFAKNSKSASAQDEETQGEQEMGRDKAEGRRESEREQTESEREQTGE